MDRTFIELEEKGIQWFTAQEWEPFPFQREAWRAYFNGQSGLINAPTGSGKTYSLLIPILLEGLQQKGKKKKGLQAIWITPIRALSKEIKGAAERAIEGLGLDWKVGIRTGDTSSSDRQKQKRNPPQILITTPESLHLLLAMKGYASFFANLKVFVADEWHEMIGSKRGVQIELALSRLKGLLPKLRIWGISATIGNLDEALSVLLGVGKAQKDYLLIRSGIKKFIQVETLLPKEIERFPWAGHLGLKMMEQVLPILSQSKSTLIFTNTRAQCEIWYQNLLEIQPDLAGQIAMHHSSISRELRDWVEGALHTGQLKAVVCTASLDLGVDFRPVETIVQIGSPKGVARFMQRAGRSGHQPGAVSKIFFVPTHSLELLEAAALRQAVEEGVLEARLPYIRSFDVLIQYLVTLSVSDGFQSAKIFEEVRGTFAYSSLSNEEWQWVLHFISTGGEALHAYEEYKKVMVDNGLYQVKNRKTAIQHRLSIGTIVSDVNLMVKYVSGKRIGTIEERFISGMKPGDVFWFAGRSLELVRIKEMMVHVRRSKRKTGKIPSWLGGRLPFSSQLSTFLRMKMDEVRQGNFQDIELQTLVPLFDLQSSRSHLPNKQEFLIEYFSSRDGYHLVFYPFEGRFVHEGMAALLAYRISRIAPISFSIAMNDYGFELLSDSEIPIEEALESDLFSTRKLLGDIESSINSIEMARRRFRDIASIAGLLFKGYPGKQKKDRHLQSSSQLFFEVFQDYEPENLLYLQAFDEVLHFQLEEARLRAALKRIQHQKIILSRPAKATPFAFPIMVDRLREKLSSEKLEDRIRKMKLQLIRD